MDRTSAPIIGLAVIIAIAASVYAYTMRSELQQHKAALANAEKSVADIKRNVDDTNRRSAMSKASLDACNAQIADLQAQLEAASKPRGRR